MTQRIATALRIAMPIAMLALVAIAAQAGQRWPHG
jgi:hypothetical protein